MLFPTYQAVVASVGGRLQGIRAFARWLLLASALVSGLAWLVAACDPDLDANGAAPCDERTPCAQSASCYRGLCVPDAVDAGAFEPDDADSGQTRVDAGPGLGSTGSTVDSPLGDAGEVADADDGNVVDADERNALDASAPRAPEMERDAAQPPTRDAGAPGSAPTPDAGSPAVDPPCTLKSCCEEARKAYEANEKRDGRWNARKGRCGCGDPDLFLVLSCGSSRRAPP